MKWRIFKGFVWGIIMGVILGRWYFANLNPKKQVLAENIERQLPIPSPTPKPSATPKPTLKPKPTVKPTSTPKPQPKYTAEEIYNFTNSFGGQYGVDANVLRYVAICESGFKPEAKNYIYGGLYQFDAATWKTFRKKMGENTDPDLRYDARSAVQTAAFTISLGYTKLWPNCYPK